MFGYTYMLSCLDKNYIDISDIMGSANILEEDSPPPVSPLEKVGAYVT